MGHSRRGLLKRFVSVPAVLAVRSVTGEEMTTTVTPARTFGHLEQAWISDGKSATLPLAYHLEAMTWYALSLSNMPTPGLKDEDRLWETITPIGGDPATWQYNPSTNAITRLIGPPPKGAVIRFEYSGSHMITG